MATKNNNPHNLQMISSLNPASCLKLPPVKESITTTTTTMTRRRPPSRATGGRTEVLSYEPMSPMVNCIGGIKREVKTTGFKKKDQQLSIKKVFVGMVKSVWPSARVRDECVVAELDRPVPATRKTVAGGERSEGLWSRRCGGVVLERLQLQEQQLQRLQEMQCVFKLEVQRQRRHQGINDIIKV